jgi:hypothetical protein
MARRQLTARQRSLRDELLAVVAARYHDDDRPVSLADIAAAVEWSPWKLTKELRERGVAIRPPGGQPQK